jgi:hypothetical protein
MSLLRLVVPIAAVGLFFLCSLITVRLFQPRQPRRFFLLYALLLLAATAVVSTTFWPLDRVEDRLGLLASLLLQLLACLTMWNAFYSLLWGFSGSLMHDLFTDASLRHRERLIRSYEGDGGLDRIMARRLPNLVAGGWIRTAGDTLELRPKGRLMALGTRWSFKVFSLGMGGGIK